MLQQGLGKPGVVRTSAALLRQLAGSDIIKDDIIRMGALETVTRAARMHVSHLGALEQVRLFKSRSTVMCCLSADFRRHEVPCTWTASFRLHVLRYKVMLHAV